MNIVVVITRDKQPRSFRWGIRSGINQPDILPLSRAVDSASNARRDATRAMGPMAWIDATEAGADDYNSYLVQVAHARVETLAQGGRLSAAASENIKIHESTP